MLVEIVKGARLIGLLGKGGGGGASGAIPVRAGRDCDYQPRWGYPSIPN